MAKPVSSLGHRHKAADLVPFRETAEETAAGLAITEHKYEVGNVLRYGADPTGATSSTTAFAAILEAGGFDVYIPSGTYEVDPGEWDATDHILIGSNTTITCGPNVLVRVPDKTYDFTTVDTGTDRITVTGHSMTDADLCTLTTTGTLPTGLSTGTTYFIKNIDANTIELYTDVALTSIVDITGSGSGTHTITTNNTNARAFMRFRDVDRCVVHGNNSIWEYETKPGADEQRHIWGLQGASNIILKDLIARKAGGDGFYVGAGVTNDYCQYVHIENCRADDCRRQGLSIVSAIDLWVDDFIAENTDGIAPQSGIDIEPDVSTDELKGIRIKNPITRNSTNYGIKCVINDLPQDYDLDIVINGHLSEGDLTGFNPAYGTQMNGRIAYNDALILDAGSNGIYVDGWQANSALVEINRPTIVNCNVNNLTSAQTGNGICIYGLSTTQQNIGNVVIREPNIIDDRATPQMQDGILARTLNSALVDTFVDGDVNTGTDRITLTAHALTNNDKCQLTTDGTLPAGLSTSTDYYVKVIDANTIELYSDYDLTSIVDITAAAGGGTHTLTTIPVCRNVYIFDPIEISGNQSADDPVSLINVINYYVRDPLRVLVRNHTSDGNVSISDHYSVETNEGASGTVILTLDNDIQPGPSLFTFEVKAAQLFAVDPETGSSILPGGTSGVRIQSSTIGDRLVLRRASTTTWEIVEKHGSWEFSIIPVTFTASDTTPSVLNGTFFYTDSGTLTITDFDDGTEGKRITVVSKGAITYDTTGTNLVGSSVDIVTASGDVTEWVYDGVTSVWRLAAFVDSSIDNSGGA